MIYLDYENPKIKSSLFDFSIGNHFSLFKFFIESLYDRSELFKDHKVIINLFKQFKKKDLSQLVDMMKDYTHIITAPCESEDKDFQRIKSKFNISTDVNKLPFFIYLIDNLNDQQTKDLLSNINFYSVENKKDFAEPLLVWFFSNNYNKTLEFLIKEYFFINEVNKNEPTYKIQDEENGDEKSVVLEEFLFAKLRNKPELIKSFSEIFYYSLDSSCEMWVDDLINKNNDPILFKKFIDLHLKNLSSYHQEEIIAKTLQKNSNLDQTLYCLNKIGCKSISQYNPETIPIWAYLSNNTSENIISLSKKLIEQNVDMFNYYPNGNRTFISTILGAYSYRKFNDFLNDFNLDSSSLTKQILTTQLNNSSLYSVLNSSQDSNLTEVLNFNIFSLEGYNPKFKESHYSSLTHEEKIDLVEDILLKTFLNKPFLPESTYYKNSIEKKEINFNLWVDSQYSFRHIETKSHLIDEHLNLVENSTNYHYQDLYFKIIKNMFNYYSIRTIESNCLIYKTYSKMIDFVANDKSLDWNSLKEDLDKAHTKKQDMTTSAQNLLSHLEQVYLINTLDKKDTPKTLKPKI